MYRFSSGLALYGGTENGKGYLIYGNQNLESVTITKSTFFDDHISSYGKRKWDLINDGELKCTQKPLSDFIFEQFSKDLDLFNPKLIHPVFQYGFRKEISRLFPEIASSTIELYNDFISFLKQNFELDNKLNDDTILKAYSDDLGPCLVATLNGDYILPPELPILFFAPKDWRILTWWINNYFSGPYPNDSHPKIINALKGEKFYWGELEIEEKYKDKKIEGVVYFLIAKFIIIYEAWMFENNGNKQADSLILYMDLIQNKGHRPWRNLY